MGTGPVEDFLDLIPIGHLLKVECLYRGSRDDHTVELLLAHHLKIAIEHHHVLYRRILGGMTAELHETDLQLQGGIGKQTDQIGLRRYLQGHQVQDDDAQGTDILCGCPGIVHDKDILVLENIDGW